MRLFLLFIFRDILISERKFGPEQQDLPTGLDPDQEEREGGETTVYRVVRTDLCLDVDIDDLKDLENGPGDCSGHQGRAAFDLGSALRGKRMRTGATI